MNHFNFTWKFSSRYKHYGVLNVFGLACGMLGALIIAKYVGASLQLDKAHVDDRSIYSVLQHESVAGVKQRGGTAVYPGVAEVLKAFHETRGITSYNYHVESLVMSRNAAGDPLSFTENRIFTTDSSFFRVFSFPFLHGHPTTALSHSHSVVLSEKAAEKYFGGANPVGRTVSIRVPWGRETEYEVTGVVENETSLTRFAFDFLLHQPIDVNASQWLVPDVAMFILLDDHSDVRALERKLTDELNKVPDLRAAERKVAVSLESMASLKLSETEFLLAIVGFAIAFVCWANFINQTIAQAYWRTRQVAILKVLGATRRDLAKQFAGEAAIIGVASLMVVLISYTVLEGWLQSVTGGHLLPFTSDAAFINLLFISVYLVGIAVAAFAPIVVLRGQRTTATLSASAVPRIGGIALRKVFVGLQFTVSTALLLSVFVIGDQLRFMETRNKGANLSDVLVVKAPIARDTTWRARAKTLQSFKEQSAALSFVSLVSSSTTVPGEEYRQETFLRLDGDDRRVMVHQNGVDENFFSLYQIPFVSGKGFTRDAHAQNQESVVLNESAMAALGFSHATEAINALVIDEEEPETALRIIGVVKDYHQTSLKYEIRPLAFRFNLTRGHCSLRIDGVQQANARLDDFVQPLKDIWRVAYPDIPFEYQLAEDRFSAQHRDERYFASLLQGFTLLSSILSCLGLFSLSLLISAKRQKEIGIRKTFGAGTIDILVSEARSYFSPLIASLAVGVTGAWILMSDWLSNYANRVEIGPEIILLAVLSLTAVFLLTISFQAVAAALRDPVKVLRS